MYEVPGEEFDCGILDYVPAWCEDCWRVLEELDFDVEAERPD